MAAVLLREALPPPWNYGVTGDGRVFFINEESRTTTWLHPLHNHPVQSGHTSSTDLPWSWESAVTPEGAPYYIDHLARHTSFNHPVTGDTAAVNVTPDRIPPPQQAPPHQHTARPPLERQKSTSKKKTGKILDRTPSATRSEDSPVSMRGWLYKQDSGGLKAWKKRWFVLADFCLFYYKDQDESKSVGSILLPSYNISPCTREDGISRRFSFKAEHENMRTYYFAADTLDYMKDWMKVMGLATILQHDPRRYRRREHMAAHWPSIEMEYNQPTRTSDGGYAKPPQHQLSQDNQNGSYRSSISSEHAQIPRNQPERGRRQQWEDQHQGDPYNHSNRYRTPAGQVAPPVHPDQNSLHSYSRDGYGPYHHGNQQRPPSISSHGRQPSDTYQQTDPQHGRQHSEPFDDSNFYQAGQLSKQKPISDLSKFDSNSDLNNPEQQESLPKNDPYFSYSPRSGDQPDGVYTPPMPSGKPPSMTNPNAHLGQGHSQGQMDQGHSRLSVPSLYKYEDQSMLDNTYKSNYDKFGQLRPSKPESMTVSGRPSSARSSLSQRDSRDSPLMGHLSQWRDRMQNSPRLSQGHSGSASGSQPDLPSGSWNQPKQQLHNNNNPIYENLNASQDVPLHDMPGRPPLPAAYREQIVKELAETRTPATRKDLLSAVDLMHQRKDEPLFFQYPDMHMEVYQEQQHQDGRGSQQRVIPESYIQAKREAAEAERQKQQWEESQQMEEQNYPDSYWEAKKSVAEQERSQRHGYPGPDSETDVKRHSSASQRSDQFYSTIPDRGPAKQSGPPPPGGASSTNRPPAKLHSHHKQRSQEQTRQGVQYSVQKRVAHPQMARPLTKLTHYDLSADNRDSRHGQAVHPAGSAAARLAQTKLQYQTQYSNPQQHGQQFDAKPQKNVGSKLIVSSSRKEKGKTTSQSRSLSPGEDSALLKQGIGKSAFYSGLPYSPRQAKKFLNMDSFEYERARQRSRSSGASLRPEKDSFSFDGSRLNASKGSPADPKHSTPQTSTSEMPSLPYSMLSQQDSAMSYPEPGYQNFPADYRYSSPKDYVNPQRQSPQGEVAQPRPGKVLQQPRPHSFAPPAKPLEQAVMPNRPASYALAPVGPPHNDGIVYAKLALVNPERDPLSVKGNQHRDISPKSRPGKYAPTGGYHEYQNLPRHTNVDGSLPRAKSLSAFTSYSSSTKPDSPFGNAMRLTDMHIVDDSVLKSPSPWSPGHLTRSKSGSHIYDNPEASADLLRAKAVSYYTKSPPKFGGHQKSESWDPASQVSPERIVPGWELSTEEKQRSKGSKPRAVADLSEAFQHVADAEMPWRSPEGAAGRRDQRVRPRSINLPEYETESVKDSEWFPRRPRSLATEDGPSTGRSRERIRSRDRSRDRGRSRSRDRSQSRDRSRDRSRSRDRGSGILDSDEEWPPRSGTITIPGKEEQSPQRPKSIATSTVSSPIKGGILKNGSSLPNSPVMQHREPRTITIPGRSDSTKEDLDLLGGSRSDLDGKHKVPEVKPKPALKLNSPQRPGSITLPAQIMVKPQGAWTNKRPKSVTIMESPTKSDPLRSNTMPDLSTIRGSPESPNIKKLNLNDLDQPYLRIRHHVDKSSQQSLDLARPQSASGSPKPRFQLLPWLDIPELRNTDTRPYPPEGALRGSKSDLVRAKGQPEAGSQRMDPARSYLSWTGDSQGLGLSPWAEPTTPATPASRDGNGSLVRASKSMESISSPTRQHQATVRPMNWRPNAGDSHSHGKSKQEAPARHPPQGPPVLQGAPLPHSQASSFTAQQQPQDIVPKPMTNGFDIHTIKEDPNMEESHILVTKKLERLKDHLNGHRLRLSISAGDLVGKSHEELVLLLIQLRRSQSRLEDARGWYRAQMDVGRDFEKEYKKRRESEIEGVPDPLEDEHQHYMTLRQGDTQVQQQADIRKPLVNLVDNLVTMGSLYGGDNLMLASQYKRHKLRPGQVMQPKKMIEFSRQHQEAKLTKEQEEQLRQLQEDEADLEEKLQKLYLLDRELQEHSFTVTSLQEDWELLQKALDGIKKQEMEDQDSRGLDRLAQQRRTIEHELSKVRQQLADSSKLLEETAADNARVENEVILLRKKIMRGLNRESSSSNPTLGVQGEGLEVSSPNRGHTSDLPLSQQTQAKSVISQSITEIRKSAGTESMRTKEQLETELTSLQTVIDGLSKQGAKLGHVMSTLRRSMPDLTVEEKEPAKPEKVSKPGSTYAETDIDSLETRDLSSNQPMTIFKEKLSPGQVRPTSQVYPQGYRQSERVSSQPQGSGGQPQLSYSEPSFGAQSQVPYGQQQKGYSPRSSYSLPDQSAQALQSSSVQETPSLGQPRHRSLSPAEQYNHSSLGDLRVPTSYTKPSHSDQLLYGQYSTHSMSAAPSHSEPNLAQTSVRGQPSPSHRLSYSQPSSVAFSEPYAQGYRRSTSLIYPEPNGDGSSPQDSDYVNIQPSGAVNQDTAPDLEHYSPLDINSADDNVKRFYGILPKDKPRATTVRDVKKRETERRGREKSRRGVDDDDTENNLPDDGPQFQRGWRSLSLPRMPSSGLVGMERSGSPPGQPPSTGITFSLKSAQPTISKPGPLKEKNKKKTQEARKSAAERLFPVQTTRVQYDPASVERVRRTSDIYTPRPFSLGANNSSSYRSVSMMNSTPNIAYSDHLKPTMEESPRPEVPTTVATVRPVFSAPASAVPSSRTDFLRAPNTATIKPMAQNKNSFGDTLSVPEKLGNKHRNNRERYRTISSSQPMTMETNSLRRQKMQSAAGDLITSRLHGSASELVRADHAQDFNYDDLTIDRLLFLPEKVEIPERYMPDSDDEVTEEEAMVRQEKSERIRKMLAAQRYVPGTYEWSLHTPQDRLQEWRENELHASLDTFNPAVHEEVRLEKRRREALLGIRQALAREVSQKTREVAEMRRKTMSEIELRHVGTNNSGPAEASSFMSLYETPTYQRHKFYA